MVLGAVPDSEFVSSSCCQICFFSALEPLVSEVVGNVGFDVSSPPSDESPKRSGAKGLGSSLARNLSCSFSGVRIFHARGSSGGRFPLARDFPPAPLNPV